MSARLLVATRLLAVTETEIAPNAAVVINCFRTIGRIKGTNMIKALLRVTATTAATLILAVQPIAAQDRSEDYERGYKDAMCNVFRELAPILMFLAPMAVAEDPELRMADLFNMAEECGIDWSVAEPESAPEPIPEPADSARCQRLAALIDPLDAEIDRLLAASTDPGTELELFQARSRRNDIEREMRREGC